MPTDVALVLVERWTISQSDKPETISLFRLHPILIPQMGPGSKLHNEVKRSFHIIPNDRTTAYYVLSLGKGGNANGLRRC